MREERSFTETVRPGRCIFVREVDIRGDLALTKAKADFQVLFQHGLCATEQQFDRLLVALEKTVQGTHSFLKCVLYDVVGCGRSARADSYTNTELVTDLSALMDRHLGNDVDIPTVWVAHSYGSTLLLHLPSKHPRPRGVVWLSTAIRNPALPHADGGHFIMRLPVFLLNCLQRFLTNEFIRMAVHPSHPDVQELIRHGSLQNDMGTAQQLHANTQWATVEDLQSSPIQHVPALVLHGVQDRIIPVECAQHLANHLSNSKLVLLEDTSHMVMLERPTDVAKEIMLFLNSLL